MEVDAEVWYWTPSGMRKQAHPGGYRERYIQIRAVERLLTDIYRKGYEAGVAKAAEEISKIEKS